MKKIITILLIIMLTVSPALSATLIYSEDFEDNNAADTYGSNTESYWDIFTGSTGVVTNNPHGGTYSLRGSISENSTLDNILNKAGVPNPHTNIGLGDTTYGGTNDFDLDAAIDSGEFYLSWYHLWDSGELANLSSDSHKIFYIYTNYPDDYYILRVNSSRTFELIVNADGVAGYPYSAGDDPDNNYQYGYNLGTYSSIDDGNWHHFAFWVKYGTGGGSDSSLKLWIDNVLVLNVDDAVAIYQTGDEVEFFGLPTNISAASTTVTTVGWQVDDVEIWDGVPYLPGWSLVGGGSTLTNIGTGNSKINFK